MCALGSVSRLMRVHHFCIGITKLGVDNVMSAPPVAVTRSPYLRLAWLCVINFGS